MTSRSKRLEGSPGAREAKRALSLEKRRPTDNDRPPPSVFPGRKPRVLPGQLELESIGDG
jgi:hypothetical protein